MNTDPLTQAEVDRIMVLTDVLLKMRVRYFCTRKQAHLIDSTLTIIRTIASYRRRAQHTYEHPFFFGAQAEVLHETTNVIYSGIVKTLYESLPWDLLET